MIVFKKGDLLSAQVEALVNTVNTVGVMGKGIALQFKNRFPNNFKSYKKACKEGTFKPGQVLVFREGDLMDSKIIINFPTKAHWRGDSKYEYIASGLVALKEAIISNGIKSIAIPPLGCGNGGLNWQKVKAMMVTELSDLDCEIQIFQPNEVIKEMLKSEASPSQKKLTAARAMLLYLMFHYESSGEQSSLFAANKLAYFLQRSGEKLKLRFEAHHYGPYAVQVNHVLLYLNGKYLKGMEQNEVKPFEPLELNYKRFDEVKKFVDTKLSFEQKNRLQSVLKLVSGFESSFALELLATVDYVSNKQQSSTPTDIKSSIGEWSHRKKNLFEEKHLKLASDRLASHAASIFT